MRFLSLLAILGLMVLPVAAQTTGVAGVNNLTINGAGSGGTSCVDPGLTTADDDIAFALTAQPGDLVFGVQATSALCVPNAYTIDATYSADIDLSTLNFFLPANAGFPISTVVNAGGSWGLTIPVALPQGFAYAIQFALVGPGFSTGVGTTQAHAGIVTLVPTAYSLCPNTIGGDLPGLSDDGFINVAFTNAAGFTFYGVNYSNIWVNMNGNLSFGAGNSDFTSSEAEMLANQPRICPTWDDWTPSDLLQGTVRVFDDGNTWEIEWFDVRHFACQNVGDSNTFCAVLTYATGDIMMAQGLMVLCPTSPSIDQLVGISPGGGLSLPNNVDLTAGPNAAINANDAIYEDFGQAIYSPYDLGSPFGPPTVQIFLSVSGNGPYTQL